MTENIYSPDYVKGLFNRMSSSYERMNYLTSFGFSVRWRTQFLTSLQPTDGKVEIIDLLTGMGETWFPVKRRFPGAALTALDFSEEMLKKAKIKSEQYFNDSVTLVQQDVLLNSLPDNFFDIVICSFGLKTFDYQQLEVLARETNRILKVGGQFSFVEVSEPQNRVLRLLYGFYLGKVIPILGRLLLGNPAEYKMLWRYAAGFKNAKPAMAIFSKTGLTTRFNSYFYGCATGFSGYK